MNVSQSAAPIMLTNRQENFAQLVAAGASSNREAYGKAYGRKVPDPSASNALDVSAHHLLRNPKVAARIAQIKAQNAAALRVSIESVTKMLVDTYNMAQQEKQASAAAQAAMGLAKLHGMIIDRAQINALIRKPAATPDANDEMSEEDWLRDFGGPTLSLPVLPSS